MIRNLLLFFSFFFCISLVHGQGAEHKFIPKKIGFLYNFGNENSFLFNDEDYFYTTRTFKGQLFYDLHHFKKVALLLVVQPQFQSIKHQLLNPYYVTPDVENFEAKIEKYTQLKTLNLYALEFGVSAKVEVVKKLFFDTTISLGFGYINETTERLAEGFTFIENFSIGFTYSTSLKTQLYLGTNFGHVSNLNFQKPNDGYNVAGLEFGFQYIIE